MSAFFGFLIISAQSLTSRISIVSAIANSSFFVRTPLPSAGISPAVFGGAGRFLGVGSTFFFLSCFWYLRPDRFPLSSLGETLESLVLPVLAGVELLAFLVTDAGLFGFAALFAAGPVGGVTSCIDRAR